MAKSFVQYLKDSGYHTIHCGKAHWGAIDTPGENPCHFGFETNIAGHAAGGLATYLSELNYGHDEKGNPTSLMSIPGLEKYWKTGTFVTEALTQEALKALDKAKEYNQPFYLYMAHYAIHIPIDKDMRFYDKYKKKGMSDKEAAYASLIEAWTRVWATSWTGWKRTEKPTIPSSCSVVTTEDMPPVRNGEMNRSTHRMHRLPAEKARPTKAVSANR